LNQRSFGQDPDNPKFHIRIGDGGGGRGPRTKLTLFSRELGENVLETLARAVDISIQAVGGSEGPSSAGVVAAAFTDRIELELFWDLELRLDLDHDLDLFPSENVRRVDRSADFGIDDTGNDISSSAEGCADSLDCKDWRVARLEEEGIDAVNESVGPVADRRILIRFFRSFEDVALMISDPSIELERRTLVSRSWA